MEYENMMEMFSSLDPKIQAEITSELTLPAVKSAVDLIQAFQKLNRLMYQELS